MGSDGFSGITANPLVGLFSDWLIAQGGTTILTEVPEMFGAETILMDRSENKAIFDQTVSLINDFKDYFKRYNQPIYENPSPGNKKGGITTLEEKSLGCVQKGGAATVVDVLDYTDRVKRNGLNLLQAPGNDLVASSALALSGCQIVLFTTGRGTPFGSFVPTMKISTNSRLYEFKQCWIDFNAGTLVEDEEADVVNRCCVPKMMAINREKVRQQLYTLVEQRNYGAIAQMGGQLPAPYPQLARHLDCRSCFLLKEAEKAAEGLKGMQLQVGQGVYPYRVYEMVEFFAMLKHQVYLKEYTYFILRVNPLLVELQMTMIREKLDQRGIAFDAFFPVADRRRKVCPIAIGQHLPDLLAYMNAQFGGELREADLSIKALNMMLRFFGVDAAVCELLSACEKANTKLRNPSAHDLFAITNEDIKRISGMTAETMVARLEKVLTDALARYGDRALKKRLNIYEHGDRLLKECL